jgi:tetratricopeptide (TPR) repeat protein
MKNPAFFFWNDWNRSDRYLYIFLLSIFGCCIILLGITAYIGMDAAVDLNVYSRLDTTKSVIDQFSKNLLTFSVEANNYLIREWFGASPLKIVPIYSYSLLFICCFAVILIQCCLTYIENTLLYTMGMLGVLLFMVNLNTEMLDIFIPGSRYFLIGLILSFGGLSYYYHAFNRDISFIVRLISFLILALIAWFIIITFSQINYPFLYVSNYGIKGILLLSLLFFIIISFDIIYGLFYILTMNKTAPTKNLIIHFPAVSAIYLLNFILFYLDKKSVLDREIIYINPFILFGISAIVGIWVFRKKESSYKHFFSFRPVGAVFYLSLGIICCSAIAYSFITANDAMREMFEYGLIYSHFCIGLSFVIYVVVNFNNLFNHYSQVYKVIFEPKRISLYVVYLIGGLGITALFFQAHKQPYRTAKAGYLNNIGDIYLYEKNYLLARQYYLNASVEDYDNWRTNYSLASICLAMEDKGNAIDYFALSNSSHPSEYSYLNLSNIYVDNDNFFPAKFAIEDGLKRFPESSILYNNLAVIYAKTSLLDSTIYYLEKSKKYSDNDNKEVPSSNMIYFLIKNKIYEAADSLIKEYKMQHYAPFASNALVLDNLYRRKTSEAFKRNFVKDTILDNTAFAYLYNYGLNNLGKPDEKYITFTDSLQRFSSNESYAEYLRYLHSLYFYYGEEKNKAKVLMENLKGFAGTTGAVYWNNLGMWMMDNNQFTEAAENLKQAASMSNDHNAYLNYCISLAEAGNKNEAIAAFEPLKKSGDKDIQSLTENFIRLLTEKNTDSVLAMEEPLRVQYAHLRKKEISEKDLLTIYTSLENQTLKFIAAAELMEYYIDRHETDKANVFWQAFSHEPGIVSYEAGQFNYQYLRLLSMEKNWTELKNQLEKIYLNKNKQGSKNYFRGLIAQFAGNDQEASDFFTLAFKSDPFNEEGIIWAVEFFNSRKKYMDAYNILVESVTMNPYSIQILKAYARQSILINIESYAEYALDKLEKLMTGKEFSEFRESLKRIQSELE